MHILCQGILYATLVRLQEAKGGGVGYGEDLQGGGGARGSCVRKLDEAQCFGKRSK